jgi:hypothetical protein
VLSEIQHPVTITRPFYMQTTEVTVDQWRAVMGRRFFAKKKGAGDMPVTKVSWHDCKKFIRKLNQMTGTSCTFCPPRPSGNMPPGRAARQPISGEIPSTAPVPCLPTTP